MNDTEKLLWLVGVTAGDTFKKFLKEHVKPIYSIELSSSARCDEYDRIIVGDHSYFEVWTAKTGEAEAAMLKVLSHMTFYGHVVSVDKLTVTDMVNIPLRELK